jgi:hypothetical protein
LYPPNFKIRFITHTHCAPATAFAHMNTIVLMPTCKLRLAHWHPHTYLNTDHKT